ncbi:MAG TPA: sigma-70 family RNA polymerase sigma factor [Flavobacteriales bacterium]|nr:sigma-70 family RNA polymerase sigma factor [Flavobacteriales bacterium]HRP81763.1 sigma-70 family RNA polymerase sigma factor [Flavobacteriales bacterium]HRQ83912.1 sigma-70 family RNA polymerase sigma factor [Flavobacteriales bacterium]
MAPMVPERLIADCIRRDPRAEHELYKALYPLMMSICSRYERNRQDASARMNEGFLKVLLNLGKRRREVPFEAWVRRIMINTVIDHYRKERDRKTHETMDAPMELSAGSVVNDYLRTMEAEVFAELLQQVPETSRKVFNLFVIDGYQHGEIGKLLGISAGTSKWHVSHARQLLQQAIARMAGAKAAVKTALP